jgi:coproporphyrinogen III oxidase
MVQRSTAYHLPPQEQVVRYYLQWQQVVLPTFQTISTKAFPTGTRMSFQQTAAPTGWTKDTTAGLDNSAMRIVTGSVVNGGSVNFTTAFASQTPTGSVSITTVSGSAGATTLTTPQIPSHHINSRVKEPSGNSARQL